MRLWRRAHIIVYLSEKVRNIEQKSLCLCGVVCDIECQEMSMDSVPKDLRGLRACKLCSMVKVSPYIYSKAVE